MAALPASWSRVDRAPRYRRADGALVLSAQLAGFPPFMAVSPDGRRLGSRREPRLFASVAQAMRAADRAFPQEKH